jgi:hypothetical protein
MPLSIFRGTETKIVIQTLRQRHRIPSTEQALAGAVAADVILVQGRLGAVWVDAAAGGVETLAFDDRGAREGLAVGEGFGLVAAEVVDRGGDLLCS